MLTVMQSKYGAIKVKHGCEKQWQLPPGGCSEFQCRRVSALHMMTANTGITDWYLLSHPIFCCSYDKCRLAFILKLKQPALTCWPLLPNEVTSYIMPAKTVIKLCHTTTIHPSIFCQWGSQGCWTIPAISWDRLGPPQPIPGKVGSTLNKS